MPKTKRKPLMPVRSTRLLTDTPSNVMQMEMLRRAIRRTDDNILRILTELEDMRAKQRNRQKELARMSANDRGQL